MAENTFEIESDESEKYVEDFFNTIQLKQAGINDLELSSRLDQVLALNKLRKSGFESNESFVELIQKSYKNLDVKKLDLVLKNKLSEFDYIKQKMVENEKIDSKEDDPKVIYRNLVNTNYIEPTYDLPNQPPSEPICGLKELFDQYKSDNKYEAVGTAIASELQASAEFIANRHEIITEKKLSFSNLPFLSELTSIKAPVPWQLGSPNKLKNAEAESLGLKNNNSDKSSFGNDGSEELSKEFSFKKSIDIQSKFKSYVDKTLVSFAKRNSDEQDDVILEDIDKDKETNDEDEILDDIAEADKISNNQDSQKTSNLSDCDIDQLYKLAGSNPPKQPGDSDPRYTFPGRLNTGEDIFYDYAVIIPVKECEGLQAEPQFEARDIDASIILISKARGVLDFLSEMQLEDALGVTKEATRNNPSPQYFHSDINNLLNNVQNLLQSQQNIDINRLRFWKRKVKNYASALRTISKTEINLASLSSKGLENQKDALIAAMNAIPEYKLYDEEEILGVCKEVALGQEYRCNPRITQYLQFPGKHPNPISDPNDQEYNPEAILGVGNVREQGNHWAIDKNDQARNLRYYLKFIGGEFRQSIDNLKKEITNTGDAISAIQNPTLFFRENFQRLASDLVYQSIFSLAKLLDEICENISLHKRLKEGNKRLALMMTYRQHWYPAGYVQGKLVGYKNLAPNQSEKVLRRTFVRTTTETSSAQEFAATRKQDYSQSSKETSEFLKESSTKFNFTTSASGNFNFGIGGFGLAASNSIDLASNSRTTHNQIAEMTNSGSVSYNEKREVKVKELVEAEDLVEVTSEITNANQEITANYFYYQLLRQYNVVTELHDIKPVLLRSRDVPTMAEVDEKFLSDNAHLLIPALPSQLGADLQDTVHQIEKLSRAVVRTRSKSEHKRGVYELKRKESPPQDPQLLSQWNTELASTERDASEAWDKFINIESDYLFMRSRLDRVVTHVRKNICYYMQYIWQGSPNVNDNKLIEQETFAGYPLPLLTRGLMRLGFQGSEEIYEYDGPSLTLLELMLRNMKSGKELISQKNIDLRETSTYQKLAEKYHTGSEAELIGKIAEHAFVADPAEESTILNERMVQIAQDALVVETMPGQIPLLEGFKMAHRMLDVQQSCLENAHLKERISDRPWNNNKTDDTYKVYRNEGNAISENENE